MKQTKCNLEDQATRLNTQKEFITWEQQCDEFIELLDERSPIKRLRLYQSMW